MDENGSGSAALTPEQTVFIALGEDGFAKMVSAFYQRVKTDDVVGILYPDGDWEGAEKRLYDFLVFRFGGVMRYIEERGHPRMRMRHAPYPIGTAERDRWLELMGQAMDETGVVGEPRRILAAFFAQVADFMRNKEG